MAKKQFYGRKKFWWRLLLAALVIPISLVLAAVSFFYWKQDAIIQTLLDEANTTFKGEISIENSHIELFKAFPFVSIDLENLKLYEDKSRLEEKEILHLTDVFVGFSLWDLVRGNLNIKSVIIQSGHANIELFEDQSMNITHALSIDMSEDADTTQENSLQFNLDKLVLEDLHIRFHDAAKAGGLEAQFEFAKIKMTNKNTWSFVDLNTRFFLTLFKDGKEPLFKDKSFEIDTRVQYFKDSDLIKIDPSEFDFEKINLNLEGTVELSGEQNIDMKISGQKDNFDLLIAFAPNELVPVLKSYGNKGKISVDALIKGSMKNGKMPAINANFSCNEGSFKNNANEKTLDAIEFSGTFTNGEEHTLESMVLELTNLSAKPEAGTFKANLRVENFVSPDIDLRLDSDFNLDFLVKFLNLENDLQDAEGEVRLVMNFHDIIDLQYPERSIEKLNESYFTELSIKDLQFKSKKFPLPFKNINLKAVIEGNDLHLRYFNGKVGKSDVAVAGKVNNVPAILHQKSEALRATLSIESNLLDLNELTYVDSLKKGKIEEQLQQVKGKFDFYFKADAFHKMEYLPEGEFVIQNLSAISTLQPHVLKNLEGGFFIEKQNIQIKRLKIDLDDNDLRFGGKFFDYPNLMETEKSGKTRFEIFIRSKTINFKTLAQELSEDVMPENIKKQTLKNTSLRAKGVLNFEQNTFKGIALDLSRFKTTLALSEHQLDDFSGKIIFWKEHFALKNFKGCVGMSDFNVSCYYYTGKNDSLRRRENYVDFQSYYLNINELLSFSDAWGDDEIDENNEEVVIPEDADTIPIRVSAIPFMDFKLNAKIGLLKYRQHRLRRLEVNARMNKNQTAEIQKCNFRMARGRFDITGKLDAQDTNHVILTPQISIKNLDIERTLMSFDNFGQNFVLSDNLSGKLSATLSGTLYFTHFFEPKIAESHIVLDVDIFDGILKKYKPLENLSEFFGDKNLSRVAFDTLSNAFELKNNRIYIPKMTINSSIGFLEISGEQNMDMSDLEYYIRIPLKLVTGVAYNKLFKRKKEDVDPEKEDEIQYGKNNTMYVNLKITGSSDDMKFSLGKDKRTKKNQK